MILFITNRLAVFATICDQNLVKLWTKKERKIQGKEGKTAKYWGIMAEFGYHGLKISKIVSCNSSNHLIFNAGSNLILWVIFILVFQ
jgi:hypothetical protein